MNSPPERGQMPERLAETSGVCSYRFRASIYISSFHRSAVERYCYGALLHTAGSGAAIVCYPGAEHRDENKLTAHIKN